MSFELLFTEQAKSDLSELEENRAHAKRLKAVRKTLGYLQINSRHPGLKTHKFSSLSGPNGEEIFEACAENNTPAAYRATASLGCSRRLTVVAMGMIGC